MVSPYVYEAAKRARILGVGSEPLHVEPGFDPTIPDDVSSDDDYASHRDPVVWLAMASIAAIAFTLGWLAVSMVGK